MRELIEIVTLAGAIKAAIAGLIAGIFAFAGMHMRQKQITNSQIRMERWVSLIGETVYFLVESHNHLHPEATIDTRRFAQLLFSIGVRRTASSDKS